MKPTHKILLTTIISFGLFYFLNKLYFHALDGYLFGVLSNNNISFLLAYSIVGVPLFIGLLIIHKPQEILKSLGLAKGFFTGFLFAFIVCLPMLVGFSFFLTFNSGITFHKICTGVLLAAFFEEMYFRGVLFGQLFRFTKMGFLPSVLVCALLFALGHLWQSTDAAILIGIFTTTFLGAMFFAWLYIEWDNNLWVPMGLHLFMNLYWDLFSGANALGNASSNVFRIITIAFAVIGTLRYKKRKGKPLSITLDTLWMKKEHS